MNNIAGLLGPAFNFQFLRQLIWLDTKFWKIVGKSLPYGSMQLMALSKYATYGMQAMQQIACKYATDGRKQVYNL